MPSKSPNTENGDQQARSTPLIDPASRLDLAKNNEKSEKVALEAEAEEDDPHLTSCGMGSWRPAWMQVFNSPFIFMLNLGLIGIIQGMTGPLFFSSISTLEKRFGFDSKISGVILIVDNFADMILNPLIGYLGVRYNRARLVGIGELILAFGSFLTASPYFIYGPATHLLTPNSTSSSLLSMVHPNSSLSSFCTADGLGEDCQVAANQGVTVWPAVAILMFGSWLRGMGYTAFFVVGVPYLDDNIKKESSPLMISIMQSMRLVGPAFGFMLSSFCLGFYENPFVDPGFGPTDPRFVGAWWMAFVVVGFLLLLAGTPLLFFPFQFKGASVKGSEIQAKMTERGGSRGALKRYLANPIILLFVLANIFRYIGLGGYIMLKSKYIESQFRKSSSSASFITGFTSYFPMAVGIMAGGSLLSFLKPNARTIFILVFLVEGVSFFTVGSGLFLGCAPINIAGSPAQGAFSLDSTCNAACDCTTRVYKPLCGPDQSTTYFSPCHAGCTSYNSSSGLYEDCSCFPGAQATPGYCPADVNSCGNLVTYISVVAVGNLIASFARTPNSLIFLRSVDPIDKSFAVGLSSTLFDIFAFIPYPLIFGYIADSACLIWEEKCGKTGNCWVYDNDLFRKLLHGAAITFYALGSFFEFLLIFFAHRVKNFYDDDEEEVEEKRQKMAKEMTVGYRVKEETLREGLLMVKTPRDEAEA